MFDHFIYFCITYVSVLQQINKLAN